MTRIACMVLKSIVMFCVENNLLTVAQAEKEKTYYLLNKIKSHLAPPRVASTLCLWDHNGQLF